MDVSGDEPVYTIESLSTGLSRRSRRVKPRTAATGENLDYHKPKEFRDSDEK